ncbi:MAG TPA: hypothetical protein VGG31_08065 [Candidatus Dormibacteraeota bacterium]|jgi:hypothetical protein
MQDEHQRHVYVGEPDDDLIEALEPDQLVTAVHQPVPRRVLSRPVELGLWGLRIFLLVVSAAVVYAFVMGVVRGGG